jgi:uncharacterized phosphosugar-binding protein
MSIADQYPTDSQSFLEACKAFLTYIEEHQKDNFRTAGEMIADRIMQDKLVYVVGAGGHSWVPPMDMFCRAGGLVPISAMMDVSTSTLTGGFKSIHMERVPGYMNALFEYHRIETDDLVLIFNNVGVNPLVIDAALECRKRGARSIGVAGTPWQVTLPPDSHIRHPSKQNLKDIVDLFIDDYNPVGDCVIAIADLDTAVAPISTITDGYIVRRIELEAIKVLLENDFDPPVWMSANSPGGDETNSRHLDKYFYRVKLM